MSYFGLENDLCFYRRQATSYFSPDEGIVVVQMDKIHVKSDIQIKGGYIWS